MKISVSFPYSPRSLPMNRDLSTDCVHAGEDRFKPHDSITTPIIQSSTFVFRNSEDIRRYTQKEHFRYEYGRYDNPTQRAAETKLALFPQATHQ